MVMTNFKKLILVMVLMILVNDAVLIGGYFYAKSRLVTEEPEQTEEMEETEAAEEEQPSNYISIDECMGSYHMKGFSIDGKTYLNRVPCDCDKDEEYEKSVG